MPLRSLNALALAALISACSATTRPEQAGGELLTTDATAYVATQAGADPRYPMYRFTVVATFTNRTAGPIHLARCAPESRAPIYGVELVDRSNAEGSAYDPMWACVGHDQPIRVLPGESRVDTLRVSGPTSFPHGGGTGYGVATGRMRLRYAAQGCVGDAVCLLSADAGASNAFEVHLAP